jgi:hypothetical protein
MPLNNGFEFGPLLEVVHHQDLLGVLAEVILVVYDDATFH